MAALADYQSGARARKVMLLRLLQTYAMEEVEEARAVNLAAREVNRSLCGGEKDDQGVRRLHIRDDRMSQLMKHVRENLEDTTDTLEQRDRVASIETGGNSGVARSLERALFGNDSIPILAQFESPT